MIKEFKEFISKGNVMDMAVGIIIGGAFTAIVNALVESILMPIIGVISGGKSVADMSIMVGNAAIGYGAFIQAIIDFLLIAWVLFMIIKALNKAKAKLEAEKAEAPAEPEPTPADIELLNRSPYREEDHHVGPPEGLVAETVEHAAEERDQHHNEKDERHDGRGGLAVYVPYSDRHEKKRQHRDADIQIIGCRTCAEEHLAEPDVPAAAEKKSRAAECYGAA